MKNKYPVVKNKLIKTLSRNRVIIATYPNGMFCFAAKNHIGVFRSFQDTCFKLAMKFSNGYATEDRY